MNDLISRKALLAEYDRLHIGEPGKARKLIEDAPRVDAVDLPHWATERAYKNGYEQGKKDVMATVGKPLAEYLHPIDNYAGLKGKYLVFKADTGERVENCFVLRPDKDTAAVEALRTYANATENKTLADDIYNWVGEGKKDALKWIPVSERLPEEWVDVLVWSLCGFCEVAVYLGIPGKWRVTWNHDMIDDNTITHWMPLPEPPKGE